MSSVDPVNDALRVLRDCEWTAPDHRARLKETLMNEYATHRSFSSRRRTLIATGVGVLALSGLGFAAAERFGWVQAILRSEVDGQVVDTVLTPDENGLVAVELNSADGPAWYQVQLPEGDESQQLIIDATKDAVFIPADGESAPANGEAAGKWVSDEGGNPAP